jgi:hypothetical protein
MFFLKMKGKRKREGAGERRGGKRWERRKWKGLHNTEEDCDDVTKQPAPMEHGWLQQQQIPNRPVCDPRSTNLRAGIWRRSCCSSGINRALSWDPRRLSRPIPCTVCNGATTTKPQPVVTRHHLPKCPQCTRANKPTGYHLPTEGNS